ncbi:hypothetical protein BpHYR1_032913 [Brachionus plicatilis]|uniref:Uncharacterized protein n=1 Tax=Brachionus plicatilis TaxID=10195 RepID=A0A3M7T4U2_BRAPC|nr:hypothetical protein BpHYR1_032913 [Brachionus plicatilis]
MLEHFWKRGKLLFVFKQLRQICNYFKICPKSWIFVSMNILVKKTGLGLLLLATKRGYYAPLWAILFSQLMNYESSWKVVTNDGILLKSTFSSINASLFEHFKIRTEQVTY